MLTDEEKQALQDKVSEYLNTKIKLHFNPNKGKHTFRSEYMPDNSKSWFSLFIESWIIRGDGQPIKSDKIKFEYDFWIEVTTRIALGNYPPFTFTLVLDNNGK